MGVLRVNVGGQWLDVGNGAAPTEEVAISPDDPGVGYDLWYDTDAPVSVPLGSLHFLAEMQTSDFLIPSAGVWHTVPLNTVRVDLGSCWQPGTYEWKAPKAGWVEVSGTVCWTHTALSSVNVIVAFFTPTREHRFSQFNGSEATFAGSGTRVIQVAANDPIRLAVYITGGAAQNFVYHDFCFMSVRYIS